MLIVTVSLVACTTQGKIEQVQGLPPAYKIVIGVIESQYDISTYQFDMDMNIDATTISEGKSLDGIIAMGFSGVVDIDNSQLSMDMNMGMTAIGEDETELSMGMYLVDNFMYMMTDIPGMGSMWTKSEIPVVDWKDFDQVEPQIELLVDAIQVNVLGSEMINGIDCYVLEIIPDMEQLWKITMQQSGVAGEEILPGISKEFIQDIFQDFSVKQWVAKDTYFLLKAELDMTMEITAEAMSLTEDDGFMIMDITMDLVVYDYNQPVSIVLPPEAEEAIEFPLFMDFDQVT
jgi:hypothetical protein